MDWATLAAAVVGAGLTAFTGWWISGRLAVQSEFRQLRAAIWIVQLELAENKTRFEAVELEDPCRRQHLQERLLWGDWMSTKLELAALAHHDAELFESVARLYGGISEFGSGADTCRARSPGHGGSRRGTSSRETATETAAISDEGDLQGASRSARFVRRGDLSERGTRLSKAPYP
jgi:hypothetical protein